MAETPIQWCDHSINPFRARNLKTGRIGHFCAKLSAGCKNCYSSKLQSPHLSGLQFVAENRSKVELFLEDKALQEVARRRKPTKYFWCDMTDMFWEEYPDEWIDRCVGVMAWIAHHIHMVLTKRSKRLMEYSQGLAALTRQQRGVRMARAKGFIVPDDSPGGMDWPLPNVWFMVSCEDQPTADERIGHLLRTPAAIRGVSYEPALGPVHFKFARARCTKCDREILTDNPLGSFKAGSPLHDEARRSVWCEGCGFTYDDVSPLHWVIVGGESGPGARPFDVQWAHSTVAQCEAAGVACFVKQMGADVIDRTPGPFYQWRNKGAWESSADPETRGPILEDRKGGDITAWPQELRVRQFPEVRA